MRKLPFLIAGVLLIFTFSCGENTSNADSEPSDSGEKKVQKVEKQELTVELYSKIVNKKRALLMDDYWDKMKGKSYEEVKDIYLEYDAKEDAIYQKYGIDDPLDMGNFFRTHFAEVEEYQKTNPEHKDYAEWPEAKRTLGSIAIKVATEN